MGQCRKGLGPFLFSAVSIFTAAVFLLVPGGNVAAGNDAGQQYDQLTAVALVAESAQKLPPFYSGLRDVDLDAGGNGDGVEKRFCPTSLASKSLDVCGEDGEGCSRIASFLLLLYLFFLFLGRYLWVVEPNNQYLMTHAERIKIRLAVEHNQSQTDEGLEKIKAYLDSVTSQLAKSPWKWVVAFTGRQMSAWRSLHEAERIAIDFYSPAVVRDIAKAVRDRLADTQSSTTALEEHLREALADTSSKADLKTLVKEAKATIYRDEDEKFEALADAQNKALWLVLVAAMILFGLSWIFSQAQVLFLAGAAGGLLARLRKVVRKRSLPFDYGVSWTVLFLTPLVGALTGWAGTLLFVLLQSWGLLGASFCDISIGNPTWASVMVALVFGYSATLFEKFVEQLEESLANRK